jgi:RNA polymerase sigma-70 factor (ECF subfamily)
MWAIRGSVLTRITVIVTASSRVCSPLVLTATSPGWSGCWRDDVVAWADGGGIAAARRPVVGRDKVVRYLLGLSRRPEVARMRMTVAEVNGEWATVHYEGDALRAILVPEIVGGVITALRLVVNPDKLAFAARQLV